MDPGLPGLPLLDAEVEFLLAVLLGVEGENARNDLIVEDPEGPGVGFES